MARIKSEYIYEGSPLYYEILDGSDGKEPGYDIYRYANDRFPWMHQPEPYIPYRKPEGDTSGLSDYEYSCFKHMEELCTPVEPAPDPLETRVSSVEQQVTEVQEGMCEVYELVLGVTETTSTTE